IARLSELARDLSDDYGVQDLPEEFARAVSAEGGATKRLFSELATAAQIANFVYQVARDLVPFLRKRFGAGGQDEVNEAELIQTDEKKEITVKDPAALAVKKSGLIRRVVRALLKRD